MKIFQIWPSYENSWNQSCKIDCENCEYCEIANCDCEEIAISQTRQSGFLSGGRNRKTKQSYFLEGRNFANCENCFSKCCF